MTSAGLKNLVAAIMRIDNPASPDSVRAAAERLDVWLRDRPEIKRNFAIWLRTLLQARGLETPVLPAMDTLEGLEMGWSKVIKELREQGQVQGAALLLQRQLSRRFGELPPWALQRIAQANQAELERWGDRVLDAESLVAVLEP